MSILFPGFTGPSYQLSDRWASVERLVNWYTVPNENPGESKYTTALAGFPQNQPFVTLPLAPPFNQPARGMIELRGEVYGVNGTCAYTLDQHGKMFSLGVVPNDGLPVSMVANGTGQIFIATAGEGWVITANRALVKAQGCLGASYATFQDGYIIAVTPDTNQFQISGTDAKPLGDATVWDGANVSIQAGQADKLRAVISSREYLRLLGHRRSQIYANVGQAGIGAFPFASYNETFIETGIAAPFSLADLGDSLIWIGEDARGQRACWRDAAFLPQRISTFAVEQIWQSYAKVDDAIAFPFIWNGHLFYQITFPSAIESALRFPLGAQTGPFTSATWVYDVTASQLLGRSIWSERQYTNSLNYQVGRPELFHCFAFGKHLVASGGADGNPGAVYQYGESGTTMENPPLLLRWSNDAGNTYTPEVNLFLGQIGNYAQRVYWNRCGYARDRVFWLRYAGETESGTDNTGAQSARPVVRDRICPHLWATNKRIIYDRIEFELSRGIGSVDGVTPNPFTLGIVNAELDLRECAS